MQTIVTLVADLVALTASLLLIANQVHSIAAKILYSSVVFTIFMFTAAYTATCAHQGECAWTTKEFSEVLFCTIRPDKCTHLLTQFSSTTTAEYWRRRSASQENENANLRATVGELTDRERNAAARLAEAQRAAADATRQRREISDAAEAQRLADQRAEQSRSDAEAAARTLRWRIRSAYDYSVEVSFFGAKSNRAWPGGNKVFVISDSEIHSFPLNCIPGEQICFGAWVRGNARRYWGVGYGGRMSCKSCCYHCGGGDTAIVTLGD